MTSKQTSLAKVMLLASSASLVAFAMPAYAQNDSSTTTEPPAQNDEAAEQGGLDVIVVTATKRSESVQDVPIAITAITGDSLSARGIDDPKSLSKAVPGLNVAVTSGYGGRVNYTLRGVGLNTYSAVQEAAVAVYQDEVYAASSNGTMFSLFDVERIEVLRGPQGTLFGRSASGGLVNFIARKPTGNADGYLTLGLGTYGERRLEAAQNVPLDPDGRNALRVSLRYEGSDGFVKNEAGGENLEGGDLYAGRVQLWLEPADGLTVLLRGEYGEFDSDHATGYKPKPTYKNSDGLSQAIAPDENIYGAPGGDLFGYRNDSSDYWSTESGNPAFKYTERTFLSGRIDWDLGDVTLTSLTGYIDDHSRALEDTDSTPVNFITYGSDGGSEQFQQEIRLSSSDSLAPFRWTIGGFYFDYKVDSYVNAQLPIGIPPFGIDTPISLETFADQKRHSYAGFGEVQFSLSPQFSVTAGARIEKESAKFKFNQVYTPLGLTTAVLGAAPVTFSPALNGDLARIDKTFYSGGITLNYTPSNDVLVYASLKRGVKPGGFSTPLSGIPTSDFKFNEEKLDALEAGIKSDLLDGKLRVNASAFHYWYNDYQAVQYEATRTFTGNTDARVTGVDLEIIFAPTRDFEFGLSGGYIDAVAKDIPLFAPGGLVVRDRRMPNAPKLSVNAYMQYRTDLAGGELTLRAEEIYRSKTFYEIQNAPALAQDAYHTEDISANWRMGDWTISGVVSNLFNEKYRAYVQDNTDFGFVIETPAKPRMFSMRVTKRW